MDDVKQPTAGGVLPLQGPHGSRPPNRDELPADFVPLRLFLQPNGPIVELTRPEMLLGRHSEADVRLPLPDVSRRHCRFLFSDHVWQVFDLDSLNGVFVNGERIRHARLHDHDIVSIGGFRFEVELSGSSSVFGDGDNPKEIIHRIADALPQAAADSDSHRKAS
jgi:pSer/pThr/pTyr-binding forkhead associated (FHA) protein